MNDFVSRFTSRKFLLALLGIVAVFFKETLHLTPESIQAITALIIAFTAAEGVADAVTRYTNIPAVDEDLSSTQSS
jgi:uncharacterized membrane protein HdeD (DUF308 family)